MKREGCVHLPRSPWRASAAQQEVGTLYTRRRWSQLPSNCDIEYTDIHIIQIRILVFNWKIYLFQFLKNCETSLSWLFLHKIYHIIWSIVCEASRHPVIWSSGQLVIQSSGHPVINIRASRSPSQTNRTQHFANLKHPSREGYSICILHLWTHAFQTFSDGRCD